MCPITHEVSSQLLLGKDQHARGCVGLLQFVVDGDERLQVAGGGAAVELLLLVVQSLGVGMAHHGTLSQQLRRERETTLEEGRAST